MDYTTLFCQVDDFCQVFEPSWHALQITSGERKRNRSHRLTTSEMMTILIWFHSSNFRTFKYFYLMLVAQHRQDFPGLVSYSRFVQLMPKTLGPLCAYLKVSFGPCTGIAFIDSTALAVCGNKRIDRHQVFADVAARGKSSMGWFFGFKLHLVVNDSGDLLAARLTPGNVDDRTPVPEMVSHLSGKLFGDKGYISAKLFSELWDQGLQLITSIRRNMTNRLMPLLDKILLRKRSLIETINDQLKNIAQIEHTRHRSGLNAMVNLVSGLLSYQHQPKKPQLKFEPHEQVVLDNFLAELESSDQPCLSLL